MRLLDIKWLEKKKHGLKYLPPLKNLSSPLFPTLANYHDHILLGVYELMMDRNNMWQL